MLYDDMYISGEKFSVLNCNNPTWRMLGYLENLATMKVLVGSLNIPEPKMSSLPWLYVGAKKPSMWYECAGKFE